MMRAGTSQWCFGTTIEILLADRARYRPSDGEEEVFNVCHEVQLLAGRVNLVTAARGMRLRAQGEELQVHSLPAKCLRRSLRRRTTGVTPAR